MEDKEARVMRVGKGRKGFVHRVRGGPGPGSPTVRELLPDNRHAGTILKPPQTTKVGLIKEGVIVR